MLNKLAESDYELLFYNHYEFQKFNSSFLPFCCKKVKLIKFGEQKVQDLLKETRLLITDYSSIYYDFFYMQKPLIFFKLNEDEFQASQYGEDYDNPSDFGYVAYSSEEIIKCIIALLENDCIFEGRFLSNHADVFPLFDNNNCKRIFEAIQCI